MSYDFVLSLHCSAGFSMLHRFQVGDLSVSVLFMVVYGFYPTLVCVCVCCFILCLSVSVDECVLEADYTWCNVYIQYVQLNL